MRFRSAAILLFACVSAYAAAAEERTFRGKALPFEIIAAIRNYGFKNGPAAQVAISVEGGTQADWLATAAHVAEQSIVGDVTFAEIDVFVPSPWGDRPPQRVKRLVKAYFAGPDPSKSPWPDRPWDFFAASHAPSLAEVEYNELDASLASAPDASDEAEARRERKMRAMIVRKYHLPASWKPDEHLGSLDLESVQTTREHIVVGDKTAAARSIAALKACLAEEDGSGVFKGCQDRSEEYRFVR